VPRPVAALLYDRDCGFCRWTVARILARDREQALEPVAIQSEAGERLLAGMSDERRLRSWHLVSSSGRRRSAGGGFAPLLDALGHKGAARTARPLRPLLGLGYRGVASSRSFWGRFVSDGMKQRADALIEERAHREFESGELPERRR
jgi:predicted DCC family thiol-disulfide oxidoreductase YuxK